MDPISEQFAHVSTYNYAENSPIANIDLHGLQSTRADIRFNNRINRYLNGSITRSEFIEESRNEANGALAAASVFVPGPEDVALAGFAATKFGGAIINAAGKALNKAGDFVKGLFKSGDNIVDLASGIGRTINQDKQARHISGHKNFIKSRSGLTADAQNLLDDLHGGNVNSAQKINDDKTRVDFGKEIGNYVNPKTGEKIPTTVGTVINSKSGVHIVPARPKIDLK